MPYQTQKIQSLKQKSVHLSPLRLINLNSWIENELKIKNANVVKLKCNCYAS